MPDIDKQDATRFGEGVGSVDNHISPIDTTIEYPYPCPYCKVGIITQEMDEMGSICNKCFFNRTDGTIGREVVMEVEKKEEGSEQNENT